MIANYFFLKDDLAILEIRKHQWIESQKQKSEIGFATAAVDWVKKYGQAWKQFRLDRNEMENIFTEKRNYRRFRYNWPLQLKIGDQYIASCTDDISLVGFSCPVPQFIPDDTSAEVTINFTDIPMSRTKTVFRFETKVVRVSEPKDSDLNVRYSIFLPFNENIRNYIRTHANFLEN